MSDDPSAAANKAAIEADQKRQEEARKQVKADREAREKASKEATSTAGTVKPTPTQEENDLAASGVNVSEHEPDGSPEQLPTGIAPAAKDKDHATREVKPDVSKQGYTTRSST
jgi:hypothetical protein